MGSRGVARSPSREARQNSSGGIPMKRASLTVAAALIAASGPAPAADQPGSFPGVIIDAKIIGGDQYEPLYTRIGEWEKLTGAKVNILSKKNGFDIDKEFKSDIAANDIK